MTSRHYQVELKVEASCLTIVPANLHELPLKAISMKINVKGILTGTLLAMALTHSVMAAPDSIQPAPASAAQSKVVIVTEEPGHIVRYRSPRFIIYTNHFAPGDWTLYHEHRHDLLAVIAGETVAINQKLGNESSEQAVPAGTVAFFPYADMPNGYVHRISVGGTKPFINVGLDFQEAVPNVERKAALPMLEGKAVTLIGESRRGRAYRVELGAGQSLDLPVAGSALLLVALETSSIMLGDLTALSRWDSVPGDFRFFETNMPNRISNQTDHSSKAILFQAY